MYTIGMTEAERIRHLTEENQRLREENQQLREQLGGLKEALAEVEAALALWQGGDPIVYSTFAGPTGQGPR